MSAPRVMSVVDDTACRGGRRRACSELRALAYMKRSTGASSQLTGDHDEKNCVALIDWSRAEQSILWFFSAARSIELRLDENDQDSYAGYFS